MYKVNNLQCFTTKEASNIGFLFRVFDADVIVSLYNLDLKDALLWKHKSSNLFLCVKISTVPIT